ncbi:MAG: hypothetical protein R6V85_04980 [Polyangia bacterium]
MTSTLVTAVRPTEISYLPRGRRNRWDRFFCEARELIAEVDGRLLRQWALGSLKIAVETTLERAMMIRNLVRAVAKGAWNEFKRFFRALFAGELGEWLEETCRRLWKALRSLWARVKSAYREVSGLVRSFQRAGRAELAGHAAGFLGGVLGFVVIGGLGDGGVIDMDIAAAGIGGHRSIWFHSALIGLAAEVCFRSAFELVELLHERLPRRHSPIWDRMLAVGRRFEHALVTGSWVGVSTHLIADSHLQGWTPYKDLPVALPEWGHHMVMDLNAAAAGWLGWHWRDKVTRRLRSNRIVAPSHRGVELPELPAV